MDDGDGGRDARGERTARTTAGSGRGADAPDRRIDDLVAQLRERGLRATTARRAVLTELLDAGDSHLTADELGRRVARRHPAIHLSTIYRTLDALTASELITIARFGDHPVAYHLTDDVHHHAVCSSCGMTLKVSPRAIEPLRRALLREYGFHAAPRHLTIAGRCERCGSS